MAQNKEVLAIIVKAIDQMSPVMRLIGRGMALVQRAGMAAMSGIAKAAALPLRAIKALISPTGLLYTALTSLAVRGFGRLFTATAEQLDMFNKLALQTGMSAKAIQEWNHVANSQATTLEVLIRGHETLSDAISDASDKTTGSAKALARLGLTASALLRMRPEDRFLAVADALEKVSNAADRTDIAKTLMGRGGGEMLRILNAGGTKLREIVADANRLGIIMSDRVIENATAFKSAMGELSAVFVALRNVATAEFFPMLKRALDGIKEFVADQLPAIQDGAKNIARYLEVGLRAGIKLIGVWRELAKDAEGRSLIGDMMTAVGTLVTSNAEDILASVQRLVIRFASQLIIPLGSVAINIGKAVATDFLEGLFSSIWKNTIARDLVPLLLAPFSDMTSEEIRRTMNASFASIDTGLPKIERWSEVWKIASESMNAAAKADMQLGSEFSTVWQNLRSNAETFIGYIREISAQHPSLQAWLKWAEELNEELKLAGEETSKIADQKPTPAMISAWQQWRDAFKGAAKNTMTALQDHTQRGMDAFNSLFGAAQSSWNSWIDSAVEGTFKITDAFKQMGKEILKVLAKIAAQESALWIVRNLFTPGAGSFTPLPSAKGNIFNHGQLVPFAAGGIVNTPTLFPMHRGMGLMGEAGPEAIMPLRRGPGGRLGVEASGAPVVNNYYNETHYHVNAIDVQSFDQALYKHKNTIEGINERSIRMKGSMRDAVRRT